MKEYKEAYFASRKFTYKMRPIRPIAEAELLAHGEWSHVFSLELIGKVRHTSHLVIDTHNIIDITVNWNMEATLCAA